MSGSIAKIIHEIVQRGGDAKEILQAAEQFDLQRQEDLCCENGYAKFPFTAHAGLVALRDGMDECSYCGDRSGPFQIDHIYPRSRGGSHHWSNLAVACRTCNASKGNRLLSEWRGRPKLVVVA